MMSTVGQGDWSLDGGSLEEEIWWVGRIEIGIWVFYLGLLFGSFILLFLFCLTCFL